MATPGWPEGGQGQVGKELRGDEGWVCPENKGRPAHSFPLRIHCPRERLGGELWNTASSIATVEDGEEEGC